MQVTGECGVILGDLEDKLRTMGYTTGHSPQSKPQAQLGGLVATRSIGQLSTYYGAIEDMIVGVESSLDTEIPDFEKLKVIRVKEYKTNKHTFLMKTVED